ncbi:hypothetical protein Cylst_3477 [Cylindrospermum stagnale PCC 7417]|uniref:Uncharacterized protein n=1 Tax=Cylindrospermum stagnale PCC 7417 TaxID=56107 RepID=K9X0Q9_9NOST|nr:hypothetical protein [Cylindrospermum stagnale]AFZ25621.1 hypothetical protein Cylst_3477 [Cylindrospermum stagnale PCC 7417]
MFLFITALITFVILFILSFIVLALIPESISNNKSVFNIVTIIVTSLIVVPPMIWMYRNFNSLYHPIGETNRWENLNNVANFLFLWFFVVLSSYFFSKMLGYISKKLKINLNEEEKNKTFIYKIHILVIMLCIVVSIFLSMDFLSKNPVLQKQEECTRFEPGVGKNLGRYVKCED